MVVCVCQVASVMSDSLQPYGVQPTSLLGPWDSPGKNTGVGCHSLLQGLFPTQGSNPHLFTSLALAGGFFTTGAIWKPNHVVRGLQLSALPPTSREEISAKG